MQKVNLVKKLALFSDHWHPRIVGELNGSTSYASIVAAFASRRRPRQRAEAAAVVL